MFPTARCASRVCLVLGLFVMSAPAQAFNDAARPFVIAASQDSNETKKQETDQKKEPSPEEKMQARFPQPVKVADLIGLPVLDGSDSTIGYVQQVVRTEAGKIQLIVPYGKRFGWVRYSGPFAWGRRPVAVPIEVVAILGRQIAALDMERPAFDAAPTWMPQQAQPIPTSEIIRIALQRR